MPTTSPIRARRGFTLFEVAISLAIVTGSVLSVALIWPVGIKAQRLARFQIYAGAKMLELADAWAQQEHCHWERSVESPQLGQNNFMAAPLDFEQMLDRGRAGMLPMPATIAYRFDSDHDEIRRILDEGGVLYYAPPLPCVAGADARGLGGVVHQPVPPEAQTLVFAVTGYAQQNALPNHPMLAWPYYDWFPSPPQRWERETWQANSWPGLTEFQALYAEFGAEPNNWSFWGRNDRFVQLAQELLSAVADSGETVMWPQGPCPTEPPPLVAPWSDTDPAAHPAPWKILAMRYLAFACHGRCAIPVGAWWGNGPDWNDGNPWPAGGGREYTYAVSTAAMAWAMRYASCSPWDWGAPRPLNRQSCFDFPLLQHDLFPDATRPIWTTPEQDKSWRVVAPLAPGRSPTNIAVPRGEWGVSGNHVTNPTAFAAYARPIATTWGDHAHFNLTAPFRASDRCRQLVCWSVDWRAYQDFEEQPAERMDAMRCFNDSRGAQFTSERVSIHPEYPYFFDDAARAPYDGEGRVALAWDTAHGDAVRVANFAPEEILLWDPGPAVTEQSEYKAEYLGMYGADRDGDGRFSRGPLPPSVRMRAQAVARFNFYDKRMPASLRN